MLLQIEKVMCYCTSYLKSNLII